MIKEYIIKSKDRKREYSVILSLEDKEIIPEKSSCTCRWGSFYRFTENNKSKGKWQCNHIIQAIRKYAKDELDEIEKNKGKIKELKSLCPIITKDLNSKTSC